jgi:hypothetical protein
MTSATDWRFIRDGYMQYGLTISHVVSVAINVVLNMQICLEKYTNWVPESVIRNFITAFLNSVILVFIELSALLLWQTGHYSRSFHV